MFAPRRLALALLLCLAGACGRADDPVGDPDSGNKPSPGSCLSGCKRGFMCKAGSCMLDPSGLWVLTVTSGKVSTRTSSGDSWDAFGGAPDPFVCLTIGTRRTCTSTQQDTFQPSWNEQFPAATATAFLSGVTVSLVDEDVSSNDPICGPDVVPVTEASFLLGAWNPTCTNGDFRATLTAQ